MNEKRIIIKNKIRDYICQEYSIEGGINEEFSLTINYGIDSLGILKMVIILEDELGIIIPDEELGKLEGYSLGEIIDFFLNKMNEE